MFIKILISLQGLHNGDTPLQFDLQVQKEICLGNK